METILKLFKKIEKMRDSLVEYSNRSWWHSRTALLGICCLWVFSRALYLPYRFYKRPQGKVATKIVAFALALVMTINTSSMGNLYAYASEGVLPLGYCEGVVEVPPTEEPATPPTETLPVPPEQPACTCNPVIGVSSVEGHGKDCPLYEKPAAPEQSEAVKAVLALVAALPTIDELAAVDTEGEGFADYLAQLRLDTAAARTSFVALTDEEKATFDAAALAKLTTLEEVLAAMPVPMLVEGVPVLTEEANGVFSYQNVKYYLDDRAKTATVNGVSSATDEIGDDGVLTIPPKVQKSDGTNYDVTSMIGFAFNNCNQLTAVTLPESVTNIGYNAFQGIAKYATVTLPHETCPTGITASSFLNASNALLFIYAKPAVAAAVGENYDHNFSYGILVTELPVPDFNNSNSSLKLARSKSGENTKGGYTVLGIKGESEIITTYSDEGYLAYLSTNASPSIDNSSPLRLPGEAAETYVKSGIWAKAESEFVAGNKYLRVTYTLRNSTSEAISNVSLGVGADVKIGNDDYASVSPTPTGFRLVNSKTTGDGAGMQFTLNCTNAPGADDVDAMWYGIYESANTLGENLFNKLDNPTDLINQDALLAFSWQGMTIPANDEITRSVVFGVGEAAAPPALPPTEDGKTPITLYLTTSGEKDITVNAKVKDTVGVTDTLYYTINDGAEQTLGKTVIADGTEKTIAGVIGNDNFVDDDEYTVKLWIMNSKGAMSEVVTKVLTVTSGAMGGSGLESGDAPVNPTPPVVDCTCVLSAPTFTGGSIEIPHDAENATETLTASGSTLTGSCTVADHSGATISYSYAEKADASSIATVSGSTLTVTGAGDVIITAIATANGKTATMDATFTVTKAAAPKITITVNGNATTYGGESLKAAVTASGVTATAITALKITAGTVTEEDWKALKTTVPALQTFEAEAAVTTVADIPNGDSQAPIFPTTITSVIIPQAIKVGNYAFRLCTKLVTVSLPEAKSIGEEAFSGCRVLVTVSLPEATSIGSYAFSGCTKLGTVSLPEATSIGDYAFYGCRELVTVSLPAATSIGEKAFSGCIALTSVSLPKAASIGSYAFNGCTALATVSLPAATSIVFQAFNGCSALATLKLGATVPTVDAYLLFGSAPQTNPLVIVDVDGNELTDPAVLATAIAAYKAAPDGNITDGKWCGWTLPAASELPKITITVNGNATTYGGESLKAAVTASGLNKDKITSLKITAGEVTADDWVYFVGVEPNNVFQSFAALQTFEIADAVTKVANIPNSNDLPLALFFGPIFPASIQKVTIPQAITVGKDAFSKCTALTEVNLPKVTAIGRNAFYNCTKLTTISLPEVTTLGIGAFKNCSELTTVELPKVKVFDDATFMDCGKLTAVNFPMAETIKSSAFQDCKALNRVAFPRLKTLEHSAFSNILNLATVKLPATPPNVPLLLGVQMPTPFYNCNGMQLYFIDENGIELTGDKLTKAQTAYRKYNDRNTDDDFWFKCRIVARPTANEAKWVAADGRSSEDTLQKSIAAVKETGGTVTLLKNVGDKKELLFVYIDKAFTKPVTLVLNGKTLTGVVWGTNNPGQLTIDGTQNGSTVQGREGSRPIYCDNANIKLKGGTYIGDATSTAEPAIMMLVKSSDSAEVEKLKILLAEGYQFENENGFKVIDTGEQKSAVTGNTVKVVPTAAVAVTDVTLDKTTLSLEAGKSETLTATVAPENATNKAVTWKTSNPAIATVDANGTVTAVAVGSATITVTTTDGGKTATCAVTVTAVVTKPAPGGKLEAPLTQDKVDDVFGEGNATLDNTTTPPKITIDNSITPEKPIEVETDVEIDLGGNTIIGKPGQPPIIVGDGDKVTIDGDGTVSGGDNPSGAGGNGITGGTDSDITIGGGVTVEGGDGTTGGDGINSGGDVNVDGSATGGNGSSGNGGDGVDTSGGSGDITIGSDGSASGGNSTGGNGNGGDGTSSGGDTIIGGDVTGGNGNGSGSGGNGTTTGSGDTTISGGGSATGGTGGNASSGAGGNGGNGSASTGNGSIEVGGGATGGNGGSGATGGTGGDGTSTGGSTTVTGGGTATGGTGGSGSTVGGNGGNGTSSGNTEINGGATGGNGGHGAPSSNGNGGNGGNGTNQGSGTVDGSGTATGGNGGSGAGTGSGGAGGSGVGGGATAGSDLIVKNGISAKVEVVGDAKAEIKLPDPAKTVDAVLSQEEKDDKTITDVKVTLKVDDKTADKPDQAVVEAQKPANSIVGAFFDITLHKTITKNNVAGSPEAVTDVPNGAITITVEIPVGMRDGVKDSYMIIRVHSGIGEALATTQSGNELTFKTDKFSTYAIAYTKDTTPPPTDHTSGGSFDNGEYDFWMNVKEKIQNADSGDVIKVEAKDYDKMPWSVMDALYKNNDTSLVITWSGKTITIPSGKAKKNEAGRIYWPLSKLAELYKGITEDTVLKSDVVTNPETGGPSKYIPITVGGELITLEAPSPTMENTLPDSTGNAQAITPPDAGFETDAFVGTPDAKQATDSSAFAVIALMLAAVAVGSGMWFWKKRHENEQSSGT